MIKNNLPTKQGMNANDAIQTTIGDLVEAVTQIALEAGKSEQEGYRLASMTVEKILRDNRKPIEFIN